VIGHSAGGYLTLMAGFCVEPRPRALVSFYGYGDIIGEWYSRPDPFYRQSPLVTEAEAYETIGQQVLTGTRHEDAFAQYRYRFYLYCRQQGLWPQEVGGHDPDREAAWFRPYCPLHNISADYPPVLLLHGDQDSDVPVEQSIQMAAALQAQGVEHELRVLPGQPHGFDGQGPGDPVVAAAFEAVLAFLDRHLRGTNGI
jgi:dipeptidyl aminopeptidase/acylaminoacyl peptidase